MPPLHLPIIPGSVLRRHHVHRPLDHRFRACARLLQSVWRSDQGLRMGSYTAPSGNKYRLGSRLSPREAAAGANFINSDIARLARREAAYREPGAVIDEERLFTNLLSSMPLGFNLFGPLKLNLDFGTRLIRALAPHLGNITLRAILFEHSPLRPQDGFSQDGTAYDAGIVYSRADGKHGLLGIEVKYSEGPHDGAGRPEAPPPQLANSALYKEPPVVARGLEHQLVREHLLAEAALSASHYAEASLVVIAPTLNRPLQRSIAKYERLLGASAPVGFQSWTLEKVIEQIGLCGEPDIARWLHSRYCDWYTVDRALEASFAVAGTVTAAARQGTTSTKAA
jgi:hypothetical protein